MRLDGFAFLADENIHPEVVGWLRERGLDIADVKERGLSGSSDEGLIEVGRRERRILITHDRDFGALTIANQQPFFGVIYLRPGHIDPTRTIITLAALFEQDLALAPPFLVVASRQGDKISVRVRHLDAAAG